MDCVHRLERGRVTTLNWKPVEWECNLEKRSLKLELHGYTCAHLWV